MTQHILAADTLADRQIMRQLGIVIGCFVVATAVLAVSVAVIMG
ncbi:MAG: hypothetical protein AAGF35_00570 [Pseudomonadota bacterium]